MKVLRGLQAVKQIQRDAKRIDLEIEKLQMWINRKRLKHETKKNINKQ